MKVILYGVITEENLGGPSIIHGAVQLLRQIDSDCEIVCYQITKVQDIAIADMNITVHQLKYISPLKLYIDTIKNKFGIISKNEDHRKLISDIKTADIVANLFGICFCDHKNATQTNRVKSIKQTVGKFLISFIAKALGVKSVKCASSYGPIISTNTGIQAQFASKWIFDIMYAREIESQRQMLDIANVNKRISVSPDLANIMPYSRKDNTKRAYIGISVSYQIINQWESEQPYIQCLVSLIDFISENLKLDVILIPNEVLFSLEYSDIHVANDIYNYLQYKDNVSIADVRKITSTQLKTLIAGCEVLVASRYHSCVAGLSSGVPTLVIGWHYKYQELMTLYGQEKWILSSRDCTTVQLIATFQKLWKERISLHSVIKDKFTEVELQLHNAGKIMFTK